MRLSSLSIVAPLFLSVLSGCATPVATPRAYLDEETAATVTVVAEPWIFVGEQVAFSAKDRDYLNMFAVDVNRMGAHKQYLAVLVSAPPSALGATTPPTLELQGAGQTVALQSTPEDLRQLGVSKPLAPSYSPTAKWWYFPVSKEILATVVRSADLGAALANGDKRVSYLKWRDGSTEIAELTSVLP